MIVYPLFHQPNSQELATLLRLERAITRVGLPLGYDGDPLASRFPEAQTHGDIVAACDLLQCLPAELRNSDQRLAHRMCKAAVFGRTRADARQLQPPEPATPTVDAKLERERRRAFACNDQLQIRCGPVDRLGRRVVIATLGSSDHRDRFDTDDAFRRGKYRERVVERFAFPDDAHDWIEQQIINAADAEDERTEGELLTSTTPLLVTMADIEARAIDWLWPQRIALGRLSLLVGRPGCGKSFLTCDMASRISTGTPWPDGSPCPRGSVILISAEDDPADTVRPRLDAHQADVSRVHMLRAVKRTDEEGRESEVAFSLADVDVLEMALRKCNDCRLVVVDPIGSFLGGKTDAHRDNEVRSVLAPVAALSEKYGAAVLVVCHTRKGSSTTAMGSRAFTGIARGVWHLSRDHDNQNRRLLLPGKSNIAPEQGGLAFSISGEPAAVHWEKDPVAMTADDALARANGVKGESTAVEEADRWLRETLDNGPVAAKELKERAKADGFSIRTLERAKAKIGVVACPNGFGGPWVWKLPEGMAYNDFPTDRQESAESAKEETLADSGETVADSVENNGYATR